MRITSTYNRKEPIMAKVSTNISLESELKKNAQELFAALGLDMTTAITLFLKQAVQEQAIPFEIKRKTVNEDTLRAISEYYDMKNNPMDYKRYDSFSEALKEVLNEES